MTEPEFQIVPGGYQDAAAVPAQLQPALDRLVALRQLSDSIDAARLQAEMVYLRAYVTRDYRSGAIVCPGRRRYNDIVLS